MELLSSNEQPGINIILFFLVVLSVFGFVGNMEYEDMKKQEAQYCADVKSGEVPDFKNIYKRVCEHSER